MMARRQWRRHPWRTRARRRRRVAAAHVSRPTQLITGLRRCINCRLWPRCVAAGGGGARRRHSPLQRRLLRDGLQTSHVGDPRLQRRDWYRKTWHVGDPHLGRCRFVLKSGSFGVGRADLYQQFASALEQQVTAVVARRTARSVLPSAARSSSSSSMRGNALQLLGRVAAVHALPRQRRHAPVERLQATGIERSCRQICTVYLSRRLERE